MLLPLSDGRYFLRMPCIYIYKPINACWPFPVNTDLFVGNNLLFSSMVYLSGSNKIDFYADQFNNIFSLNPWKTNHFSVRQFSIVLVITVECSKVHSQTVLSSRQLIIQGSQHYLELGDKPGKSSLTPGGWELTLNSEEKKWLKPGYTQDFSSF